MRARVSEARGRWFDSSRSLHIFDIRGLGKRINPLGLGPRESRFKSEVPDQVLWGSQVVRRLAVNQFMRRFESCPQPIFGAFYVGSIPALGAKIVLAWCTVHRRTYKPLRSRSEHGLGSTPSASTMRSKLMRMSRRFLIVRQLVRFQLGAPSFWNCGRMVRRSTFNRDGESSILSSSTNETILPASSSG